MLRGVKRKEKRETKIAPPSTPKMTQDEGKEEGRRRQDKQDKASCDWILRGVDGREGKFSLIIVISRLFFV